MCPSARAQCFLEDLQEVRHSKLARAGKPPPFSPQGPAPPQVAALLRWEGNTRQSERSLSLAVPPALPGTHVFKAADGSSLVTVILQELPPVETQDQSCRAEGARVQAGGLCGSPVRSRPRSLWGAEVGPFPCPTERSLDTLPTAPQVPAHLPRQWPSG